MCRYEVTKPRPGRRVEERGARGGLGPFPFPGDTLPDADGTAPRPNGTSFTSRGAHLPAAREKAGIPKDPDPMSGAPGGADV